MKKTVPSRAHAIAVWCVTLAALAIVIAALAFTASYEYFTMWSLTVQLVALLVFSATLVFPTQLWVRAYEGVLTPTAFVVAVSVLVSTVVLATDHASQKWYISTSSHSAIGYVRYVVAHVISPILIGILEWMSWRPLGKDGLEPQWFGNSVVCAACATIPIEIWSALYNPTLVYHTNIRPIYLVVAFACTALGAAVFAVAVLGARLLVVRRADPAGRL